MGVYGSLHHSLDEKVGATRNLADKLDNRTQSVEQTMQDVKQSLRLLEDQAKSVEAPKRLNHWRQEQRARRPEPELVHDDVEIALDRERQALAMVEKDLADGIQNTKGMLARLQATLHELNNDLKDKQSSLMVEERCLKSQHRPWQSAIEHPHYQGSGLIPSGTLPSGVPGMPPGGLHHMSPSGTVHSSTAP